MNNCLDCGIEISRNGKRCRPCSKMGIKQSEDHKRKIGLSLIGNQNAKGFSHSEKAKKKISLAIKGRKHTEKAKQKMRGRKVSEEAKEKMSKAKKGNKLSIETRKRMSLVQIGNTNAKGNKGKKHNKETKRKISLAHKGKRHSKESRIKMSIIHGGDGDINRLGKKESFVILDREWAKEIYKRDNYTCVLCKEKGGDIHAHHILRKALYPKLRYKVKNGITLCDDCHFEIRGIEENYELIFNAIAEANKELANTG